MIFYDRCYCELLNFCKFMGTYIPGAQWRECDVTASMLLSFLMELHVLAIILFLEYFGVIDQVSDILIASGVGIVGYNLYRYMPKGKSQGLMLRYKHRNSAQTWNDRWIVILALLGTCVWVVIARIITH